MAGPDDVDDDVVAGADAGPEVEIDHPDNEAPAVDRLARASGERIDHAPTRAPTVRVRKRFGHGADGKPLPIAAKAIAELKAVDAAIDDDLEVAIAADGSGVVDQALAAGGRPPLPGSPEAKAAEKAAQEAAAAGQVDGGPPAALIAQWEAVNARALEVEAGHKALERDRARFRDVAARVAQDPLAVLRDLTRESLGGDDATDAEVDDELGYLLAQASIMFAGGTLDTKNPAMQMRLTKREVAQLKAEQRRLKALKEAEGKTTAEAERTRRGIEQTTVELGPELAKFPWLAKAETGAPPAAIVWDVIREHYEGQTGPYASRKILTVAEAARMCDDHFRKEATGLYARYSHLLTPTPTPTTPKPQRAPGGPPEPVQREASKDVADRDRGDPDIVRRPKSREERRRATFDKFRQRFADDAATD